mmetsp:Transcript_14795/g.37386  ORF Transcript_14795/g.37386 Transcript_14795/m.37386 type:complete len:201 (+) Transcript_14795:1017-1619(+)
MNNLQLFSFAKRIRQSLAGFIRHGTRSETDAHVHHILALQRISHILTSRVRQRRGLKVEIHFLQLGAFFKRMAKSLCGTVSKLGIMQSQVQLNQGLEMLQRRDQFTASLIVQLRCLRRVLVPVPTEIQVEFLKLCTLCKRRPNAFDRDAGQGGISKSKPQACQVQATAQHLRQSHTRLVSDHGAAVIGHKQLDAQILQHL